MVDVSVEILASSVPIGKENIKYKVKTWWAHVDFEEGKNLIKIPNLPMIEHYYNMTAKPTTVFVEMWYRNEDFPPPGIKFLGMAKCQVDEQLKDPRRNPSVVWLEVYDPIEGTIRGRLLLKVDAKFIAVQTTTPESMELTAKVPIGSGLSSSYFVNQNQEYPTDTNLLNSPSTIDSSSSSPFKRNVIIQTDTSTVGSPMSVTSLPSNTRKPDANSGNPQCLTRHSDESVRPSSAARVSVPTISKNVIVSRSKIQDMEKASKEKVNQKKKVEDKGSPFNVRVGGRTYTIQVDSSGPKVVTTKNAKKIDVPNNRQAQDQSKRSSNYTSKTGERTSSRSTKDKDDSVDDVIHLLNDHFDEILLGNQNHDTKAKLKVQHSRTPEIINSDSGSTSCAVNKEILRLRRQQMDRVISESEISEGLRSPGLSQSNKNNETDASDFSPFGPSSLGVLGLGFQPQPARLSSHESNSSPVMEIQKSDDSISTGTSFNEFRLPRTRRMAAVFNH